MVWRWQKNYPNGAISHAGQKSYRAGLYQYSTLLFGTRPHLSLVLVRSIQGVPPSRAFHNDPYLQRYTSVGGLLGGKDKRVTAFSLSGYRSPSDHGTDKERGAMNHRLFCFHTKLHNHSRGFKKQYPFGTREKMSFPLLWEGAERCRAPVPRHDRTMLAGHPEPAFPSQQRPVIFNPPGSRPRNRCSGA